MVFHVPSLGLFGFPINYLVPSLKRYHQSCFNFFVSQAVDNQIKKGGQDSINNSQHLPVIKEVTCQPDIREQNASKENGCHSGMCRMDFKDDLEESGQKFDDQVDRMFMDVPIQT